MSSPRSIQKITQETATNFTSFSAKNPTAAANTRISGVNIRRTKPENISVTPLTEEENNWEKSSPGEGFSLGIAGVEPEIQTTRRPAIISAALLQTPIRNARLIHRST